MTTDAVFDALVARAREELERFPVEMEIELEVDPKGRRVEAGVHQFPLIDEDGEEDGFFQLTNLGHGMLLVELIVDGAPWEDFTRRIAPLAPPN